MAGPVPPPGADQRGEGLSPVTGKQPKTGHLTVRAARRAWGFSFIPGCSGFRTCALQVELIVMKSVGTRELPGFRGPLPSFGLLYTGEIHVGDVKHYFQCTVAPPQRRKSLGRE